MPKSNNKSNVNEIKSADVSIGDLYDKYVKTIDNFRSLGNPPSYNNTATVKPRNPKMASRFTGGKDQNPAEFQESRAHAFYRMVGFPIVSKSNFYTPGFNPQFGDSGKVIKYNDIDAAFFKDYPALATLMSVRETSFKEKINIFRNKDNLSLTYANVLPIVNKFNFVGGEPAAPLEPQMQNLTLTERVKFLDDNKYPLTDKQISLQKKYISDTTHILKPFIVHPSIYNAVIPGDRMMAVPFLQNDTDVKVTDTKSVKKTIIELVLTARLSATKIEDNTSVEMKRLITSSLESGTNLAQKTSLEALGGSLDFTALKKDKQLIDSLANYNDVEQKTIQMFSDSIRSVVSQLNVAIENWNKVSTEIQVQPVPNTYGPEFGGVSKVSLDNPSNIDVNIAYLQLKQALAEGTTQIDLTQFAQSSGLDGSLKKDQTSELAKLMKQRDDNANSAMQSLKAIEIITGEVSGIGLVDILAVHLTLWSMDITYLLGLLDNNAIKRCRNYNNGQFKNLALLEQEAGKRPDLTECLEHFEKIFFNVLNFADAVFDQSQKSQTKNRTK